MANKWKYLATNVNLLNSSDVTYSCWDSFVYIERVFELPLWHCTISNHSGMEWKPLSVLVSCRGVFRLSSHEYSFILLLFPHWPSVIIWLKDPNTYFLNLFHYTERVLRVRRARYSLMSILLCPEHRILVSRFLLFSSEPLYRNVNDSGRHSLALCSQNTKY